MALIVKLKRCEILNEKDINPFTRKPKQMVLWKDFPSDPEMVYQFRFLNVAKFKWSDYDNNKRFYMVYEVEPLENYPQIDVTCDRIIFLHLPTKSWNIAFDRFSNKNWDEIKKTEHKDAIVHISRKNEKTMIIHKIEICEPYEEGF